MNYYTCEESIEQGVGQGGCHSSVKGIEEGRRGGSLGRTEANTGLAEG